MKKLSVIILASILAFSLMSCSDDDSNEEQEFPTTGVVWKLDTIEFEDNDGNTSNIETSCEIQSTLTFKGDGSFTRSLYVVMENDCVQYDQSGTWTENDNRELNLVYTEGANIIDAQKVQITSTGLEELVSVSNVEVGTIEVTRYIYKF